MITKNRVAPVENPLDIPCVDMNIAIQKIVVPQRSRHVIDDALLQQGVTAVERFVR